MKTFLFHMFGNIAKKTEKDARIKPRLLTRDSKLIKAINVWTQKQQSLHTN